ncbi:MAG: family 20 glycosylhydrolase [Lysobacterales bacterium]
MLLAALALAACQPAQLNKSAQPELSLIPQPALVEPHHGLFHLRQGAPLIVDSPNAEALGIARRFADLLARTRGIHLDLRPFGDAGNALDAIEFSLDARDTLAPAGEGYELLVDAHRIRINAREARGLFYGGVTLWQLLTRETAPATSIEVPALRIVDAPRFAWRGAMLDSARHFQPVDFIKRFIDQLALLKLNTLHWHLTDDQGWRIEIRRYPRLTEVGAWRRPAGAAGTGANGQPVRYGGYYTQDEIRDIVRYAAERAITIVPEIDMPGHMQAAIAAYPELGSAGDTPVVSPDWGVHSYLLNVDESTFVFMQNVLDEVMQLFPGAYIHIGGDEAVKDQWRVSPGVQSRMRELRVRDENHLQGWFVARLQKYLAAHGRRLIGWDEILEGDLPPDAAVMSWRGAQGGIDAARQRHDVVMAPSPDLYLDHLQSDADDEPSGRPDLRTLADIYAFQPLPSGIDTAAAGHVLGAQANLWTEHMRTPALVEHAAFPRLAALAEVLWSPPSSHDWTGFVARLVPQMQRWHALGIAAAGSAFEVRFADVRDREAGRIRVTLSNQVALPIRYTLDDESRRNDGGSDHGEPSAASPLYRDALQLPIPSVLHAATFLDGRRVGEVQTRDYTRESLLRRSSAALKQCSGKLTLRLADDAPADAPRAFFDVDLFDPCWIWPQAPLDGVADVAVTVGRLAYNFQLGKDVAGIVPRPAPESAHGELLVKVDACTGATIATLLLDRAFASPALTTLEAHLAPLAGMHDLCFMFSGRGPDPLWAIDSVQLVPAR